jgi:hypothetical protein
VGNPRSSSEVAPDEFKISSIGSRQRDFVLDGPVWLFSQLTMLFYARNEQLIKRAKLPWFVPTKYGGLGLSSLLTPYGGDMSPVDRAICCLISKGSNFDSRVPLNIKVEDDWQTHKLVLDLLHINNIKIVEVDEPCEFFTSMYSTLCLGVLNFNDLSEINPSIQYGFDHKTKQSYKVYEYMQRIRRARRFWATAQHHPGVKNKKNREFNPHTTRFNSIGTLLKECDLHLLEKEGLKSYNCKFEELTSLLCQIEL